MLIDKANPAVDLRFQTSGETASIWGRRQNLSRWLMRLGDGTTETGAGNTGSDFKLYAYNDLGNTVLSIPLSISRADGLVTLAGDPVSAMHAVTKQYVDVRDALMLPKAGGTMTGDLVMSRTAAPGTGAIFMGNSGTRYFYFDGARYILPTSPLNVLALEATSNSTMTGIYNPGATNRWDANGTLVIANVAYKPGGGSWVDSSDARIKDVRGAFTPGLAEIERVNPVRYAFKGNASMPTKDGIQAPLHENETREFVGVVAQDIERVLPETVTKVAGMIDGVEVNDLRIYDSNALIYALVNAVKELAARVEFLESRE